MSRKVVSAEQTLRQELEHALGAESPLCEVQGLAAYDVEGLVPAIACFPRSAEQVAQVVRSAGRHQTPVVPWGHGSKQHIGPPLLASGLLVSLDRMTTLLELEAANMTVRAGAGIGLKQLEQFLKQHGLFLPLDPPDADRATLGGCLAANSNGPRRLGYGTVRDLVLGVTVVLPTSETIRSGGRTVKNVAGYNLRRLFVGSWGTLGIITEATLRLLPLPEARCTLSARFKEHSAPFQVMSRLMSAAGGWLPAAAELMGPGIGRDDVMDGKTGEWTLLLQLEAASEVMERQAKEASALATECGAIEVTQWQGADMEHAWQGYRRRWQWLETQPGAVRLKTSLLFTRQAEWLQQASDICLEKGLDMRVTAHAGNGILYTHLLPVGSAQEESLQPAIEELGRLAARLGGFQQVEVAPLWLKRRVQFLPDRGDYALMRRIKASLDPHNLLNPGRVLGPAETE